MPQLDELLAEADRQFTICNACRYCQDYCAVFPAMERRDLFTSGDLGQLASLCHDCRSCYQACMYTEPHDFAINIPKLMSEARTATYEQYARPKWLHRAFGGGAWSLLALTTGVLAIVVVIYAVTGSISRLGHAHTGPGSLYEAMPHLGMVAPALTLSAFALTTVALGVRGFWRETGDRTAPGAATVWWQTLLSVASLRWMRGGGAGCYYPEEERASDNRRWLHHLVAYGFLATFAATVSAFLMETLLDRLPPYAFFSVPVLLGTGGGIAMTLGCFGLLFEKSRSARRLAETEAVRQDYALLVSLTTVAVTGLLLLILRSTGLMGITLAVHLAAVFALYLTAPYGKFVHVGYRVAAILRDQQEREAEARV